MSDRVTGRPSGRCAAQDALADLLELTFPGDLATSDIFNERTKVILAQARAALASPCCVSAADQASSSRSDSLIRRLWEMSEASGQHTEDRAVWAAAAAHIGGLRARLADQEQVKEALGRALDAMHSEASRWVYLDAWPENPETPEDWQRMAKARAEWVVQKTAAALALLGSHEEEER